MVFFLLVMVPTFAIGQKLDANNLTRTWYLDKYSDEEQYYAPPKKEIGDYLDLRADKTYVSTPMGNTWN